MNLHNMRQKNLFDSYNVVPSPIISRCYSSKANVNTFTTATQLQGNSLFSVNKYLSNMGDLNKKNNGLGQHGMRMPPLASRNAGCDSACDPLVKIVGGFVGSKSQAGITNHRGREFSLWDVIVDKVLEVMEPPEQESRQPTSTRKWTDSGGSRKFHKLEGFAMIGVGRLSPKAGSVTADPSYLRCVRQKWMPHGVRREKEQSPERVLAPRECTETHATPLNLVSDAPGPFNPEEASPSPGDTLDIQPIEALTPPLSQETCQASISKVHSLDSPVNPQPVFASPQCKISRPSIDSLISESDDDSVPSDVLSSSAESHSVSTFHPRNRVHRSISECSADSDDSFIVFESPEDDSAVASDESDEDDCTSDEDLDEIDNCILIPHNCDFSSPQQGLSRLEEANKKWNDNYSDACNKSSSDSAPKKVRFAEGKDLIKVKRLVTWDFAHRAARAGPWEMYHRDSERFKLRINSLSTIISPVLAQNHRKKIFSQRFLTT